MRRNQCKKCRSKKKGQYYEIMKYNTILWLCDDCIQAREEKVKLTPLIR